MRRFIFCLVFGLYLDLGCLQGQSSEQDKVCDDGDFCQYVCQCNKPCQADLKCSDNDKCKPGWFGYRCQYQDLAVFNATLTTVPSSRNVDWLTDQNDTTCNTQTDLKSITVTWLVLKAIPLTWTRITVNDPQSLSIFEMQFIKEGTTEKSSCLNETLAEVNNKTLDRRCNDNVRITSLTLSGNLSSLCSFYISGGRNIAYKQKAEQSSVYSDTTTSYGADLAVDGNRNNNFNVKTCTHTNTEKSPSWNLTLQSNYVIKRFILYNRGDSNSDRLKGFVITTYDAKQSKIGSYKDKTTSAYELTYYANLNGSVNTAVNFTLISLTGDKKILTLCEVEAYGECPAGKWSLPCSKQCMDLCPDTCDRDTGLCNVVCIGYSNPPQCNTACSSGKWGINCRHTCSDRCEGTCHAKTGLCDKGCKGYSDPPNCETACSPIKWGTNCSLNCSEHCQNSTCNSLNGNCKHGCKPGYQLADCKQDCPKGQWGQNCTSACNENCYDGMCNNVNGSCVFGCIDGFQLPNCTLKCFKGAYGRNCSSNCSTTCDNGECDPVKGACGLKATDDSSGASTAIGIVLALLVVIIIVISIIMFRRKKRLQQGNLSALERLSKENLASAEIVNAETKIDTIKNEIENPKIPVEEDQPYNEVVEVEDTSIKVEYFNSFMASKDENFFIKQFEKIPEVNNVTQHVGLNPENKIKNRYKNICPYDHSRVHLATDPDKKESDYINASYIRGFKNDIKFIAAQGPQKATLNDFVKMLLEQKVDVVVMLTELVEDTKVKCERYWPESDKMKAGQIKVKLGSTQVFADYTIRNLELSKKGGTTHSLTQIHFTSWPDKGVPTTQWSLVDVENHVNFIKTNKPIVVHCSAGVGRTGTFIALYNIMRQAEETGLVDFFKTVSKLREDRIFMVQTHSQYMFLHEAAQVAIVCMRTTLTIHDFNDRLKLLEQNHLGKTKLESEFKGLCEIFDHQMNDDNKDETDDNVYQNSDLGNVDKDKSHLVYLPGYKEKVQYILAKLPTTSNEAKEFWKLVATYNISLIVAIHEDSDTLNYLPNMKDDHPVHSPYELKSIYFNKNKLWEERRLTIQTPKVTKTSTVDRDETDAITHLSCVPCVMDSKNLLKIIKKCRECQSKTFGKVILMCKNGVTWSGFMAVLSLLLDRLDNESYLSIPLVVGTIRSLEPRIVSNFQQYRTLYQTIGRHIETSTQYTNMDMSRYQTLDNKQENSVQDKGDNNINTKEGNEYHNLDELVYANTA